MNNLKLLETNDKLKLLKNFGSYFCGLIEGNGVIKIPKSYKNSKNKIVFPVIHICFNLKDINLVKFLNKLLGGFISYNKTKTYCLLSYNKNNDIIFIINLINGFFRTPKFYAFKKLVEFLNINCLLKIIIKPLDTLDLNSNS